MGTVLTLVSGEDMGEKTAIYKRNIKTELNGKTHFKHFVSNHVSIVIININNSPGGYIY